MKTKLKLIAIYQLLSAICLSAQAQGTAFTYQGRLNDGVNPANGKYDLTFALFSISGGAGGQIGSTLTNSAMGLSNGLFTVTLDFGANFPGVDRWLEIGVRTNGNGTFTTLAPRQKLTPTPYAITAENVVPGAGLSGTYGSAVTLSNAANSFSGNGTGLTNVNAAALNGLTAPNFWQLGGNNVSSGQLLGCTNNQLLDLYANGVRALRLVLRTDGLATFTNAPNVIGGSPVNLVNSTNIGGTVGGGGGYDTNGTTYPNSVTGDFGTVGGGYANTAGGVGATVSGGHQNTASGAVSLVGGGSGNTASADEATVGGGFGNTASGQLATAGGGALNTAGAIGSFIGGGGYDGTTTAGNLVNSKAATIGGGLGNHIPGGAEYAFIGGGQYNTNSGEWATISGGYGNTAKADSSFIGGGENNTAGGAGDATVGGGGDNTASGLGATVSGGQNNAASGDHATVAGGGGILGNSASGIGAMAAGGAGNTASGDFSFAAGSSAQATHNGSFVWADNNGSFNFLSTAANQFSARATGGVRFVTAIDGTTGNATAGVKLAAGDTAWSAISDRNAKKNFQPVDALSVLNKLAAMPVERWNYKWEADTNTPHLGPMAQDFKAAFYPGRDDKSISTLEFDGVELAAIQGLNDKVESGKRKAETQIEELRAENAELKHRLEALEKIIRNQKSN